MKKILIALAIIVSCISSVQALTVRGYYKSNGTYVAPYYRSKADSYTFNNYSYKAPSYSSYIPSYNYSYKYSYGKYAR